MTASPKTAPPPDWDRSGLPAWSFFSAEMLELEKEVLFRSHWQAVCHSNDIPNAGDFVTLDFVGERVLILRGQDGEVRAFHNLCRHRGSRGAPVRSRGIAGGRRARSRASAAW